MTTSEHPILNPAKRSHIDGGYSREELRLAQRNHGILLEAMRHDVTPAGIHYLLIHFDVPFVPDVSSWRLTVSGAVSSPIDVSLSEIKKLPQVTRRVTLECAGNGRATLNPRWQSQPWNHEAVGTAEWTGTPLRSVLERAGLTTTAKNIVFTGMDRGFDGGVEHNYGRSLSVAQAMDDDVLLVTAMNGQPLLPQHGFPLRLIVPGWYGMASVKWLNRIEAITDEYQGFQQVRTYVYRQYEGDPGTPVTAMRVKSLMVPPGIPDWYTRGRVLDAGKHEIFGRAWSGSGIGIAKVEVGVDGIWHDAILDAAADKYEWRGWRFNWNATVGEHELMCRATDANGDIQPLEPRFDRTGFGNNATHSIAVTVR